MNIILDECFQFGLGAFETIALVKEKPIFLKEHLERLNGSLTDFSIPVEVTEEEVTDWIAGHRISGGALKIAVSRENKLFLPRENHYKEEDYERGSVMEFSSVLRNETSPLTYHKTMNYGDCILEKRRASALGLDEVIFCNSKGEIAEGSVSNVFFTKGDEILTPELSCGLLPGVFRRYLMERYTVTEGYFGREDLKDFDGCFITNSLMGVMPVQRLGEKIFSSRKVADRLRREYGDIVAFLSA
jgi:4-amino-4-deoxychorismate lyase